MKRKPGRLAEYDKANGDYLLYSFEASNGLPHRSPPPEFPSLRFREWTDEDLADLIARNPNSSVARLAASEVRRREAWQTPARWTLVVSVIALFVSFAAVGVSIFAVTNAN